MAGMPIIGETSLFRVVQSLRELWGRPVDTAQLADAAVTTAKLAEKAAFSAHKNGTNQTGLVTDTPAQVTWSTELFDVGGHFGSNVWTPPAGLVALSAAVRVTGQFAADEQFIITITKNGSPFRHASSSVANADQLAAGMVAIMDKADGTDTYGVSVTVNNFTSGNGTIDGDAVDTWFMGALLGP